MQVMLGLQYSDFWADPARQLIPARWLSVANNLPALQDSVYAYTVRVLTELDTLGLMPDIVKIGNENNGGILRHTTMNANYEGGGSVSNDWTRHAALYNTAIQAVRTAGATASINPQIAVHFAGWDASYFFQNLINKGVADFDIMGFSYYYAWHGGSIAQLESFIQGIATAHPAYEVMVVETGYLWTTQNFDALGNIINAPDSGYLPVIPKKQLEYLVDYTRAVMRAGGAGVIFWEPAWVSTPCTTPWGQGSSQDHVVFFDPVHTNFMVEGGGRWPESPYYQDLTTRKVRFTVDMNGADVSHGVFIAGTFSGSPPEILRMAEEGNGIYSYFTYLPTDATGGFYFLNDSTSIARETVPPACADWLGTDRRYLIPAQDTTYAFRWESCDGIGAIPDSVRVTFAVDMTGQDVSNGVYLTGNMTGDPWLIWPMTQLAGNIYTYSLNMKPGAAGAYYFLRTGSWTNYLDFRETVPAACAEWWNSDRGYVIPARDTAYAILWGSCESFTLSTALDGLSGTELRAYPNPVLDSFLLELPEVSDTYTAHLLDMHGRIVKTFGAIVGQARVRLDLSDLPAQRYLLRLQNASGKSIVKLIVKA
jgi:arabinogalactan endo-1,4-beta-galactosidase